VNCDVTSRASHRLVLSHIARDSWVMLTSAPSISFTTSPLNYAQHILGAHRILFMGLPNSSFDSFCYFSFDFSMGRSDSHLTGTSIGAPLSLTKTTRNLTGLVLLAFRPTT